MTFQKYFTKILITLCLCSTLIYAADHSQLASFKERDYWPTSGWKIDSPEKHGIDAKKLAEALEYIEDETPAWSILIIKNGYLISENYFKSGRIDKSAPVNSVTKSITSTVFGIAVDKKLIKVNQPIKEIFPDYLNSKTEDWISKITFNDVLTMTWGFEWGERGQYSNFNNKFWQWLGSKDWIKHSLSRKKLFTPGTTWLYDSSASHLLSAAITRVTKQDTAEFAQENLFTPIGIPENGTSKKVTWQMGNNNIRTGGFGVMLTPREMAKFGYLMLNKGYWEGKQIVSEKWIELATSRHVSRNMIDGGGYGFQWWTNHNYGYYFALGYGGQSIIVIPEKDTVIVTTSQHSARSISQGAEYIKPHQFSAIVSKLLKSVSDKEK